MTLLAAVPPGGHFFGIMAAVAIWLFAGVVWFILLVVSRDFRRRNWITLTPVVAAVTVTLVIVGVPMRTAFLISEPALTAYVESLPKDHDSVWTDRFVGLFPIRSVYRTGNAVLLDVDGSGGLLEQCGFAYSPHSQVKDLPVSTEDHLTGNWYVTCTDFD